VFHLETYSLYNDKTVIGADKKMKAVVGHAFLPDDFDIQKARDDDQLYLIKTHGLPEYDDKVIYLIRDGRESTLSYMHYLNNFGKRERSLLDVITGDAPFGGWGDHVNAWNPGGRQNTLLIKFEELVDNPLACVESVAAFISKEALAEEIPTFMDLKSINELFFRRGNKDDWKSSFSKEDSLAFWLRNYDEMSEYGYHEGMPKALINSEAGC